MSRTNRNIPFKFPSFAFRYDLCILNRDGFSSKRSPDRYQKNLHNKLLRRRQKEKLTRGEEFLINKKSHIYDWW